MTQATGIGLVAVVASLFVSASAPAQLPLAPLGYAGYGRPLGAGAVDSTVPKRSPGEDQKANRGLIANADLEIAAADGKTPRGFECGGDFIYSYLGNPTTDRTGWGVRLLSGRDADGDGLRQAHLTYTVRGLKASEGRWFRFRIRGLAQEGFSSSDKQLFLKAEFFAADGKNSLDAVSQNIYGAIEQVRRDVPTGDTGTLATVIWRSHALEFRTPFAEIDTLRLTVGLRAGDGQGVRSEFMIDEVDLERIPDPADYRPAKAAGTGTPSPPPALATLVPLGGRWYYDPRGSSTKAPSRFDHTNADRLYYLAERLETPFADNMTAWLRRGYVDHNGKRVEQDRFVPDNVIVTFTKTHLVIRSHNLPNHPTAVFPDVAGVLDGNPNVIREQNQTFHLPLEPKVNPQHRALTGVENRYVMNPGPIGVAVNGVVFFDPYDADAVPALWRLDRCCGHPSPRSQYHYHKYPVCIKTPWVDDGTGHSPLIGFAFDGFPVFGPYEAPGVMAKDSVDNPLNEFNVHTDEARGPHYHVTPGKFPYMIGGYWGTVEPLNVRRPGMRPQ